MNTKNVPDRELCQILDTLCKEKGIVVPETEYAWYRKSYTDEYRLLAKEGYDPSMYEAEGWIKTFPAPLVSEQGEWLLSDGAIDMPEWVEEDACWTHYEKGLYNHPHNQSNTEANARIKMINYLIAEGIITTLCPT
jgi:hypothetical protein